MARHSKSVGDATTSNQGELDLVPIIVYFGSYSCKPISVELNENGINFKNVPVYHGSDLIITSESLRKINKSGHSIRTNENSQLFVEVRQSMSYN